MNAEFYSLCDRLLSAVLNGLGQGLLLLLVLIALLKLFRTNAATRHGILLATLVLLALLPVAQFWPSGETETPVVDSSPSLAVPTIASPTAEEAPFITTPDFVPPPLPEAADENTTTPNTEIPLATSDDAPLGWTISLPPYFSAVLVIAWGVVSALRLGFLSAQVLTLRSLKRNSLNAPPEVRELFSKLCVELGVSRAPQLRVTKKVSAPMAVGFKEPAVLLPGDLCANTSNVRVEQILRHELAHVLRRDDWANLLQQTIRALFFFHPGIIWASRRLTVDREIACDDHVISVIADRKSYALSLTEFASRSRAREEIAAPAGWSNDSQLKQRITMILDTKRNASPRLARGKAGLFAAAALIAAALAFQATPRLAFAQDKPEAPPAEPVAETPAAESHVEVSVSNDAVPVPERGHRIKAVIATPAPPADVAIGAPPAKARPPRAVVIAPAPRGQLYAVADPSADEPAGPGPARAKKRAAANNQDSLEQRLDRLEAMVESLVRQNKDKAKDKNAFQFEQRYDLKPGSNFNMNKEDWDKFHAKIQKEAERSAKEVEKAMKDMKLHGDIEGLDKTKDELKAHRKALEEQKRALDKQMQALQSQIQKLERDQERLSEEKERRKEDQKRRERDEEKHDDEAKEKPEKP